MNPSPNEIFIQQVESLLDRVSSEYKRQESLWPKNDIRPAFLGLPGNILHSLVLHLEAVNDTITWPHWWQRKYGKQELLPNDIKAIDECAKLMKHSYLVFFFARIETLQRKSINILSPGFDLNFIKPYKQIYDHFLEELNLNKFIDLFDIVRLVRNSVHANGYHIPHNGKSVSLEYKGIVFEFSHLKQIEFMTIENFIFLLNELVSAIIEILNSPNFSKKAFIENKFN